MSSPSVKRWSIFVDNLPLILRRKIGLLPSLKFDKCVQSLPRVVVDMGAVAHVANGARHYASWNP